MNGRRVGLAFAALAGAAALAIAVRGNQPGAETNAAIPVEANASTAADDAPMPYRGVLDIAIGEPIAETVARSTCGVAAARGDILQFQSFEIIDLKVRLGGRSFDFGRMGGGHDYPWTVEESAHGRFEGGPADDAGIRAGSTSATIEGVEMVLGGDIITKIDNRKITGMDDVINIVNGAKPGDTLEVTVVRGDETKNVEVKLGVRPDSAEEVLSR